MRALGRIRLVDALAAWGVHEASGRWHHVDGLEFGAARPHADAVEFALLTRSPLIWRLLAAGPAETLSVEIGTEDLQLLVLADGRSVSAWTEAALAEDSDSGRHIRRMADAMEPVRGPLFCSARKSAAGRLAAPIVVFDGWHRVAAWAAQVRRRDPYSVSAHLLVTRQPVALLPR